ncbi:MAG: spore coat protein [Paenibacillus dendritiformis]|uniref:spore coat protein n=1 Tax=Paenibacillus dendritiformis TaxID=130049 RepID=UPI00143D9826|nr:spore coat protein [Paenibacillus dendritiformis]MDU5144597.1 spore coat protein [Paenibacillus dendritiformis]NKI24564.1 spore coat protein [Paenibacillus dendritiformis]NRF99598.1 spore coat protein [Paenibacillus dendritiformis]GIO76170.1 spore coat protein [Paenibacillus dendritiformis]
MNTIMENLTGMAGMTDQAVATDMLIAAKSGIKDLATALTEAATPEVRTVLRNHLDTAIQAHEQLTAYMMKNGYYHPYNLQEQLQIDMNNASTALNMVQRNG